MAIEGVEKVKLTSETVLRRISEYDIFRYYMPHTNWQLNQVCISPFLRGDHYEHSPSFLIGNKNGNLSFIDFTDTSLRGGCFDFVRLLNGDLTFNDTLSRIDADFGLGILPGNNTEKYKKIVKEYTQPEELGKRYCLIQVTTRKFTKEELNYWSMYYQDITDLQREHVYSIQNLYLNKNRFPLKETDLRFGYFYDGFWKIYRPFIDKRIKWVPNNVPITTMDGKMNITNCDTAFINKSKKDYMVMKKIFPYSCAVQNEGIACFSIDNVNFLKANSRRQILSFDSDAPGVANSQQITKIFEFDYCNVPRMYLKEGVKDWADLARLHGLEVIKDYLETKNLL